MSSAFFHLLEIKSIIRREMRKSSALLDKLLCIEELASMPDGSVSADGKLLTEIEKAKAAGVGGIRFSPLVERYYHERTRAVREHFFVITASMGTVVYDLFLFFDRLVLGDQFWFCVALQLGLVTPVSLGFILAVSRGKVAPNLATVTVLGVMLGGVLLVLQKLSGEAAYLFAGVCLLIVIGATLNLGLSSLWALGFTVFANAAVTVTVLRHPGIATNTGLFIAAILAVGSFYALMANYRIDAGVRMAFLHALMERLRAEQLAINNRRLETLVDIDGLTGVGNRRSFDTALDRLWNLGEEHERTSVALFLIDIDRFKLLNDTHGHLTGDACLRHVARILADGTVDGRLHLARYGGEEFAVLIAQGSVEEAYEFAEELRLAVEQQPAVTEATAETVYMTVSIGCAAMVPDGQNSATDLIAAADIALYLAKQSGRNRTKVAGLSLAHSAHGGRERRLAS